MYFDGSSTMKEAEIGIVLVSPLGESFLFIIRLDEYCTNNQAEYEALIFGLELLLNMGVTRMFIRVDSQLVIQQVTRAFKCQSPSVMALLDIAKEFLDQFDYAELEHFPRTKNEVANNLAQAASGYK